MSYAILATSDYQNKLIWCGQSVTAFHIRKSFVPIECMIPGNEVYVIDTMESAKSNLHEAMEDYPNLYCRIVEISKEIWKLHYKNSYNKSYSSYGELINLQFTTIENAWKHIETLDKASISELTLKREDSEYNIEGFF